MALTIISDVTLREAFGYLTWNLGSRNCLINLTYVGRRWRSAVGATSTPRPPGFR
jgi:hypothetical protein